MRKILLLLLLFILSGCLTIGEKKIPRSDVDSHTAEIFVQTNETFYNQNEYLSTFPKEQSDSFPQLVSEEDVETHRDTTQKLLIYNDFLSEHGNEKIKGSGFNLGIPLSGTTLIIIGILALTTPLGTWLLFAYRRVRKNLKTIVHTIKEDETKNKLLLSKLSPKMDSSDKLLISKIKQEK